MIPAEYKILDNDEYVSGYFLTPKDLVKLVRNFQSDQYDGFVSNDELYIEEWMKKHERIKK